jgi:hypothetical protein
LYYVWITRFIKEFQLIDAIRDTKETKHQVSKVYSWYLTLQVYIKPEEDAKAAAKKQKEIEALERAKNMKIDENNTQGVVPKEVKDKNISQKRPNMKTLLKHGVVKRSVSPP